MQSRVKIKLPTQYEDCNAETKYEEPLDPMVSHGGERVAAGEGGAGRQQAGQHTGPRAVQGCHAPAHPHVLALLLHRLLARVNVQRSANMQQSDLH